MGGALNFTITCATSTVIWDGTMTSGSTWTKVNSVPFNASFWTLVCVCDGTYWYIN